MEKSIETEPRAPTFDTVDDATAIRIVVLPVQPLSFSKYEQYLKYLSECSELSLDTLGVNLTPTTVFAQRPLHPDTGQVMLRFLTEDAERSQRSDWSEFFQCSQRVHAAIGVVDASLLSSLDGVAMELDQAVDDRFTSVTGGPLLRRTFAFEPNDDLEDNNARVVVIPDQDAERVAFYLTRLVADLVAEVLTAFDAHVMALQADTSLVIRTPLDEASSGGDTDKMLSRARKRTPARLHKYTADLCLLAGSPLDAISHYRDTLEEAPSGGDHMWVAGAHEGYAAALLACARFGMDVPESLEQDVITSYQEAIVHYQRLQTPSLPFEVSSRMRLARYFASLDRREEASAMVMEAVSIADAGFFAQDRISLHSDAALVMQSIRYRRKAAFFLRLAALGHRDIYNWQSSHTLLQAAANALAVNWPALQLVVMDELARVSAQLPDHCRTATYLARLLVNLHVHLTPARQRAIAEQLARLATAVVAPDALRVGLPCVEAVACMHAHPNEAVLAKRKGGRRGPFIYSSFDRTSQLTATVFEAGRPLHVQLTLANPFAFALDMAHVAVRSEGVALDCTPVSITIPPHTPALLVTVIVVPWESGTVSLTGVQATVFGFPVFATLDTQTTIQVAPKLPLLALQSTDVAGAALRLYEGEHHTIHLALSNTSSVGVDELSLAVERSSANKDVGYLFSWDQSTLHSQLPLPPAEASADQRTLHLPVRVLGLDADTTTSLTFRYASSETAQQGYHRTLSVPIRIIVSKGLQALNFNVHLAPSTSLSPSEPAGAGAGVGVAVEGEVDPGVESGVCVGGDDFLLVFAVSNRTSATFQLSCDVLEVADDVAGVADDVDPTLLFGDPRTMAVGCTPDKPSLCARGQTVMVEPTCVQRVVLSIPRFLLPPDLVFRPPQQILPGAWSLTLRSSPLKSHWSKSEEHNMRRMLWYKLALLKRVRLKWRSSFNSEGFVPLDTLTITPRMLAHITPDPLSVAVTVAGHAQAATVCCAARTPITVTVVSNLPDPTQVRLQIVLYQQPAAESPAMPWDKILVSGSLCAQLALAPFATASHTLWVVFLEPDDEYRAIARVHLSSSPAAAAAVDSDAHPADARPSDAHWSSYPLIIHTVPAQ